MYLFHFFLIWFTFFISFVFFWVFFFGGGVHTFLSFNFFSLHMERSCQSHLHVLVKYMSIPKYSFMFACIYAYNVSNSTIDFKITVNLFCFPQSPTPLKMFWIRASINGKIIQILFTCRLVYICSFLRSSYPCLLVSYSLPSTGVDCKAYVKARLWF